jgi:hypothetical protein
MWRERAVLCICRENVALYCKCQANIRRTLVRPLRPIHGSVYKSKSTEWIFINKTSSTQVLWYDVKTKTAWSNTIQIYSIRGQWSEKLRLQGGGGRRSSSTWSGETMSLTRTLAVVLPLNCSTAPIQQTTPILSAVVTLICLMLIKGWRLTKNWNNCPAPHVQDLSIDTTLDPS